MEKKKGFIPYDGFKLLVSILLLLAIIILSLTLPGGTQKSESPAEDVAMEELAPEAEPIQADETTAEAPEGVDLPAFPKPDAGLEYDAAKGGLVNADGELIYTLSENGSGWVTVEKEEAAEMDMPEFPKMADGLEYDDLKYGLVNADGELIYTMNEDGSGWIPVIPDDLASMKLEGEWNLLGEDGNPAYTWDAESQSWVAVEKAEEKAANTNIVDCDGAAEARLEGGKDAEVLRNVNFRSSPTVIGENWIGGFSSGDQLKVMGETACTPYGNGAYLWWQIERADGTVGWVAESAANSPSYFIGPIE